MIDREVRLAAWPGFALPDLDGVADGARTRRRETVDLDTTYVDTRDLRLGRRGITIRHRRRGPRETWTLELPGAEAVEGRSTRTEVEVRAPAGEVPAEIAVLVAAHVRTATLVRVAHLTTVRRRTRIEGPDGPLAEIDDDEVSILDGGRVSARYRELKVVVAADAGVEVVDAVVARLRRAGAEVAPPRSEVAAALGPRATAPPEAAPVELGDTPTAAAVVEAALRAAVSRLLDHHPSAAQADPEGVHQARVACRRLRSDLRTFRSLLDRSVTDPLRAELRWVGSVLGEVRDPDLLARRLRAGADRALEPADVAATSEVLARLDADREEATLRLGAALGSDRYRRLLDALVSLAEAPPTLAAAEGPARHVLPGLVGRAWKQLREEVADLDDDPSDDALHSVRKRAKQVRYAVEAAVPAFGRPARKAAKRLRRLQDALGAHHDAAEADAWLRAAATAPGVEAEVSFALGALAAEESRCRRSSQTGWIEIWGRAADPHRWAWLEEGRRTGGR